MLTTIVLLAVTTFAVGMVLGFIGAGGAGILLGILTSVFDLPIQQAIGTSIATMCFVTLTGSISHFRESNVVPRLGVTVGIIGMFGAVVGAELSQNVSPQLLKTGAGLSLWVLATLVWARTRYSDRVTAAMQTVRRPLSRSEELAVCGALGIAGGTSAGFFGVGMAPFLQLGFLTGLRLSLRQTIGTTMLTLVFISAAAAVVLGRHGDISQAHLVGAVMGTSSGSFVGAKFTKRAPKDILRTTVVAVPIFAGGLVLFG